MARIIDLIREHEKYRGRCINLVPSENVMSLTARKALISDLVHRYHHKDFYGGQKYIQEIIEETRKLLSKLFKVNFAFPEPLSGNISLLSAILALSKPRDKIAMISPEDGGYPINLEPLDRIPIYLPYDESIANINVEEAIDLIHRKKPKLIILGSSFILFPQPVKAISDVSEEIEAKVIYDGSHVLGLIAGKQFQDPLREGADVLLGSTHKTFPGPQGGVILTNDDEIAKKISKIVGFPPVLIDNPHINRIAALGITAQEMLLYGKQYAYTVIQYARRIAQELFNSGIEISFKAKNFTNSHQIWLRTNEESGRMMKDNLEEARIIVDTGVRIGSQEIVRRGITEKELIRVAEIISKILKGDKPSKYRDEVELIASKLNEIKFSLDQSS